jgi:hypothetical protein
MARDHGRILCRVWSDRDFKRLPASAQRTYFLLISQRLLNYAGVIPLTTQRWANTAPDLTEDDVRCDLADLEAAEYIVIDEASEELLVRSLIRNDGIAKQPNVLKAALRQATEVESAAIRHVLAAELRKLGLANADRTADEIEPDLGEPLGNPSRKGSGNPSPNPSGKGSPNPSPTPREPFGGGSEQGFLDDAEPLPDPSPNPSGNPSPNPSPNPSRGVVEKRGGKGYGEGEGDKGRGFRARTRARGDPDFDEFWDAYPKKVEKVAAEKAWLAALNAGVDPAEITAGARRYATERDGEDRRYTKHPATWLTKGCWDDEPARQGAIMTEAERTIRKLHAHAAQIAASETRQLPAGRDPL